MDPAYREYYQWIQVLAYYLQVETWPFTLREISQQDARTQIVIAAQSLGLDPRDKDIYIKLINKIDELLTEKVEILDTSQLDVVKIRELVEEYEKHLASVQERTLKSVFPTVDEQIRANQKKYAELLRNQLAAIDTRFEAKIDDKPTMLAEVASWDIAFENSFALPRIAREVALKKEEYEEVFTQNKPVVEKVLGYAAVKNPKVTTESFIKEATKETPSVVKDVAVSSRYLVKEVPLPPPPKFTPEDLILPEKIAEELAAEPEGVGFLPVYALLEPRVAGAWVERAVFFLPAKVIQASADEATPEWQEMIGKGVFVEDIEASIARLKELGIKENEPIIISLEDKAARLREQQKVKIIRDKKTIYKDTLAARILKRYHRFSKLTGQQQIFLEEIKAHLPRLSPAPIWTRGGYSGLLRRGLNKFSFITRLFEKAELGPEKTVIRPYLSRRFMQFITRHRFSSLSQLSGSIYRKTFGRLLTAFGESFIGRPIKSGIKRAATWLAAKAGVKLVAGAISAGVIPAVSAGWQTFKKVGKAFLGFLAYLFMVAAHYGPLAVAGLATSLAVGTPFAIMAAKGVGVAVTGALSFLGPLAPVLGFVSGVLTFFIVEAIFAVAGLLGGIGLQMLLDKIGAGLGGISLPQAGTAGLTQAGAAAASTAKWFVPAATATAVVGGIIVSQVVSTAFVIPSEGEKLTSPYIEVTKTVEFSGNIGNPIKYTIQVKAVDKNLTKVKIVDQATALCQGTPPKLSEHPWDGTITISAGETWEQTYTVDTNNQFNNCLISNTVRITATVEGKTEESFAVGHVVIGNPPEVIPWGLPIHDNPERGTGYTFGEITDEGTIHQGIDVHGPSGATVYSTFPADSRVADVDHKAKPGWYIILSAGKYQILLAHLAKEPAFKVGDKVGSNAPVGIQGATGHADGEHVHYQIWEGGVIVDPRDFGVPMGPGQW